MPFRQVESLSYFQFDSLSQPQLFHAVFTRHGGVSPAPWDSLNVGATVGDHLDRVSENRRRTFEGVGLELESTYEAWQVHSADVVVAKGPRDKGPLIKADILITRNPNVTLFMRFADCVPILLYDPKQLAIGLVHAGWLGTVRKATSIAVDEMQSAFGSRPEDLVAGIGPSIGPDHYRIGPDVEAKVHASLGSSAHEHLKTKNRSTYFDLWTANQAQLMSKGVENIEVSEICTACNLQDWFSHRGEQGRTGRFGALITMNRKMDGLRS